jgi:acetylornithine deacetylase/succinyl-diaminopimelate desuccinylase-like protein
MIIAPLLAAVLFATAPPPAECRPRENPHCAEVQRIARNAKVTRPLKSLASHPERQRPELIDLNENPAPPIGEGARARHYLSMLREAGADSTWLDDVGNAIALRRGTQRDRRVVIEGHLDTVFPEGTDVQVRVRGDTLAAPGVGDDSRGLVAVLGIMRALASNSVRTEADVLFIGTVGEEGLGDLRGVKFLFRPGAPPIDAYISLEPGDERVTVAGIGSHRYRVTIRGPGGHSWGAFGTASPIHALGRAIALFDQSGDLLTRGGPRASYNVGRIGGGTSVNSIAYDAWMEVDLRAEEDASLAALDRALRSAVALAVDEENSAARHGAPVVAELEQVGDRPSGAVNLDAPLVRRATAVIEHFGGTPAFGAGSTNANIPFALGVPAVTIGAGGSSGGAHALSEWWTDHDGTAYVAVQRALLLVLAQAGLAK